MKREKESRMGSFFTKISPTYVPYIDSYHWDGKSVDKVKRFIQEKFPFVKISVRVVPSIIHYKRIDLLHTMTKDTKEVCLVVKNNTVIDILPNTTETRVIDLRKQ